jgi:hypothetical protein
MNYSWWKSNLSFMFPINGISRSCIPQFNNKYICDASTIRNILPSGLLLRAVQPIESEVSSCLTLSCKMIVFHLDDLDSNSYFSIEEGNFNNVSLFT